MALIGITPRARIFRVASALPMITVWDALRIASFSGSGVMRRDWFVRGSRWLLLGRALMLLCASLAAGGARADDYQIGFGDKLRISIYQWEAITNTYTVDSAGAISLPILGSLQVAGRTTQDVSSSVAELLATRMKLIERPIASVEIVQFRPFSVLGDVAKPGEYSYRPGMIVLDALAMAGGFYRQESRAFEILRSAVADQTKLAQDNASLKRLQAQRLRLHAAAYGDASLNWRGSSAFIEPDDRDRTLIDREAALLSTQQTQLASQSAALEGASSSLSAEITNRQAQITAIQDELRGLESEQNSIRALVKNGMSTTARETALDVTIADVKRTQFEIASSVVRAQQEIKDNSQRKNDLLSSFRVKMLQELSDVDGKIEDLTTEAASLSKLIDADDAGTESAGTVNAVVVRRENSQAVRKQVSDLDPVLPGDIVIFTRKPPEAIGTRSSGSH